MMKEYKMGWPVRSKFRSVHPDDSPYKSYAIALRFTCLILYGSSVSDAGIDLLQEATS